MITKRNSCSNKKVRHSPIAHEESGTKSHLASTHLKTSQDLYSNIYRLPLKEILQQRREQQASASQKKYSASKQPIDMTQNPIFKSKNSIHKSTRKISGHQESARQLRTDRSSREITGGRTIELKRINTELSRIGEQECLRSTQKPDKKEYVTVKLQDMAQLLSAYSKLKSRNCQLVQEIQFYEKELGGEEKSQNSVLKALSA